MRLLVVEDDKKVAGFIRKGLQEEGYAVDIVHDGIEGANSVAAVDYDVVVLDLMLPKLPGLALLRQIRTTKPRLPVLVLTAKSDIPDRVAGLDSGADDYMAKPFAMAELSARIRALLRRGVQEDACLRIQDLEVDTIHRTVTRGGRRIELTVKEFALLEYLLRHAGRPLTRTMITEHVWDIHFDSVSNVVDVHINSLRNKIDKDFSPHLIRTVRGVGYILTDRDT